VGSCRGGPGPGQDEPCMQRCDAGETLQHSDLIRLAFRKPVLARVAGGMREGEYKPR